MGLDGPGGEECDDGLRSHSFVRRSFGYDRHRSVDSVNAMSKPPPSSEGARTGWSSARFLCGSFVPIVVPLCLPPT